MAVINSVCLTCKSCMDDMPYIAKPGKNAYSAETYIGNWYEDTVRNTIRRDEFLRKRECGDLKIQRTQTMIDLLLKPVRLYQQSCKCLHYGDLLQIMCPGPSCSIAVAEHPFKRGHCRAGHLALSACVPPSAIDRAPYLSTDSIISASPLLYPVVRNSFVIEKPDNPTATNIVNYGDVFRIRALPTQHFTLYLFSAPASRLHNAAIHSGKPKVRFSDVASMDTLWSAWPTDPAEELRVDLGVPVPMNKRLYIKHNGTGIHLSTEPDFPVLTYFGEELEVTTDTKKDRVRRIYYPNFWYFDANRGKQQPDDNLRQFMRDSKHDASVNMYNVNKSASEDEKIKEQERKEAEGDDDDDDDDDPAYAVQQQIGGLQIDEKDFKDSLRKMDISKDPTAGGQLIYDSRTGPQPNAYSYKVFRDEPYYPNRKWNCGDTDCCNIRPGPVQKGAKEECCKCVEMPEPLPNPNVRDYLLNDLIR